MRPAGPVDRLWPRRIALRREQARGDREIHGPDHQDGHDPLHPVHPLRALRRGSRRASRRSARSIAARTCRSPPISSRRSSSELSGNVVDLCPVGALTAKPYAFEARPWELKKTLSIDVMDAVGTNIRLDSRGRAGAARAAARSTTTSTRNGRRDKTRYAGRRPGPPPARQAVSCARTASWSQASWDEAFAAIAAVNAGRSVAAIAGDLVDCETMFAAKALLGALGSTLLEGRQTGMDYDVSQPRGGQFQHRPSPGIETADAILLVGSQRALGSAAGQHRAAQGGQARREGVRDRAREGPDLSRPSGSATMLALLGKLPEHVGRGVRQGRAAGGDRRRRRRWRRARTARRWRWPRRWNLVRDGWNGFNVLHIAAARMGGLMLGFAQKGGIADVVAAEPEAAVLRSAPTRSISRSSRTASRSISAIMATRARMRPT